MLKEAVRGELSSEVVKMAELPRQGSNWGKIQDSVQMLDLEELNMADKKIILTAEDLNEKASTRKAVTVALINVKKADWFADQLIKKEIFDLKEFYFSTNDFLEKYFFRRWALAYARDSFLEKANEIKETLETGAGFLCLASGITVLRLERGQFQRKF